MAALEVSSAQGALLAAEVERLGAYGSACNIRLAAVHAALTAPAAIKPTPSSPGSPANIPGYYIKREGV